MEELAIRIIETTPAAVRRLTLDLTDDEWRVRPAPGEWSAVEIVGHLIDKTEAWGERFRRIAGEDDPRLPAFDQDTRVIERNYQAQEPRAVEARATETLLAVAAQLRALPAGAWSRPGTHEERGKLTLGEGVRLYAISLPQHVEQLVLTRDAALSREQAEA